VSSSNPADNGVRVIGAETGVELRVSELRGSELVRDYLAASSKLAPYYGGFPFDPEAFLRKADAVHARLTPAARGRLLNAFRPTRPSAAARLQRVLAGDGLVVTTGQQAGLFGGPLYTVHKILTAVQLAAALEELLGQTVLPVFWVAADDHDWAEVNHTALIDSAHVLRRIELPSSENAPPVPMGERRLDDAIDGAVNEFIAALPVSEFAEPLAALVRRAYVPGTSMAGAFGDLLAGLFAETDLVLVDPANADLKRAAAPLVRHELDHVAEHGERLRATAERLAAHGYLVQVTIATDAANVFYHDEQGRERLTRENGGWLLRRTKRALSDAELHQLVEREPPRFSANVLLRPVVESALLPTVAYVGGPAEIGYFAQIGCLFHAHGIEPPLVVPRHSVVIVEPRVRKVLDKFNLQPADVMRPFHEVATRLIQDELPDGVRDPVARLRAELSSNYDALVEAAAAIDPTLRAWVTGVRNNTLSQVDNTEKKIMSHLKKRSETELEQLRKAAISLYPDGTPQERVLNALPFLARYGPGLLRDLAQAMRVRLDRTAPHWQGTEC
jgi:bacillithiol biosynthesis cysteine-adding enzyme BshC